MKEQKIKLSLKIIESYNLPKVPERPDYDDAGYTFTLPNGLELFGFFMLNNTPCEMNSLEGLDGEIYIETKEELEALINMSEEELFEKYPD